MATGIPDHPSVSCLLFPIHCRSGAGAADLGVKLLDRYSFDLLAAERAQKALGSRGKSRVPSKQPGILLPFAISFTVSNYAAAQPARYITTAHSPLCRETVVGRIRRVGALSCAIKGDENAR